MKESVMREAFFRFTQDMSLTPPEETIGLACFRLGAVWAENEMLHHIEDSNSLQFPEHQEGDN